MLIHDLREAIQPCDVEPRQNGHERTRHTNKGPGGRNDHPLIEAWNPLDNTMSTSLNPIQP
jgi:hypothetical protein